jgi:protein-S-isoprenylcysteine O-methyltransferase Ste14
MNKFPNIVPPAWAGIYLAAGLVLHFFWLKAGGSRFGLAGSGIPVAALGFAIMFWGWKLFHNRGTSVCPFDPSTYFVREGPFRFTRNPMYLGMTLILLGIAFAAGTPPVFLTPLAFFLTLNKVFIPYEEKKMEETFGEDYLDYKRRVRRWV